ncbi:hypothetical protein [Chryseobacterium wanjuense]
MHFKEGEVGYYPKGKDDDTHLSKIGAELVAKLALRDLKSLKIGLEKYIK